MTFDRLWDDRLHGVATLTVVLKDLAAGDVA